MITTDDVIQANSYEFFDGFPVKLFTVIHTIFKLKRHQMYHKSHKLFLAHEIAFIAFAKNLIDNIFYDGTLRSEEKFITDFWWPHFKKNYKEIFGKSCEKKSFKFLTKKNYEYFKEKCFERLLCRGLAEKN